MTIQLLMFTGYLNRSEHSKTARGKPTEQNARLTKGPLDLKDRNKNKAPDELPTPQTKKCTMFFRNSLKILP